MQCGRCPRAGEKVGSQMVCDRCIAADENLYYSLEHLKLIERRLAVAIKELRAVVDRGIGDDRRSNPTKGRARLNEARSMVAQLTTTRSLIRSVLVGRGDVSPTIDESLERNFPGAKNNEIVLWDGRRFRHRWIHEGIDYRGRNKWSRTWTPLGETE